MSSSFQTPQSQGLPTNQYGYNGPYSNIYGNFSMQGNGYNPNQYGQPQQPQQPQYQTQGPGQSFAPSMGKGGIGNALGTLGGMGNPMMGGNPMMTGVLPGFGPQDGNPAQTNMMARGGMNLSGTTFGGGNPYPGVSPGMGAGGNPLMNYGPVNAQTPPGLSVSGNSMPSVNPMAFLGGMPGAGQILDQRYAHFYGPQGYQGPWTANG